MQQLIRNIAVFAHADAGKTTITEQFLLLSGTTRRLGNVDNGTAQTDYLPVEQERGISVRSAHTSFIWNQCNINLIDTPGHVDFSSDVEKIMRVTDGAILVISAVEGVQAHTQTLWNALRLRGIPVLIFVNKIDRMGADLEFVYHAIEKDLGISPVPVQKVTDEGESEVSLISLWSQDFMDNLLVEKIISEDDELISRFLDGEALSFAELDKHFSEMIKSTKVFPLFFGSAKLGLGMEQLLDAMVNYLPSPGGDPAGPLSALVFGVGHDKNKSKIAHIRMFSGSVSNREMVFNATRHIEEKVIQVRKIFPGRYEDTGRVDAGDIAGISGLESVKVGDLLGISHDDIPSDVKLSTPLIIVQVKPKNPKDFPALAAAMQELDAEDPSLELDWLREESELQVKIMGWIQMEVLERILLDRFGIEALFENPTVIYQETPATVGEGFVQYWMPKPCWAIMKFKIEPGERGSGVQYSSLVSVNDVQQKYQNEVARSIATALKQGIKGWEVTDIKITLIEGEDHPVHSRAGDFTVATPMGIMNGLVNTGTTLLEPVIEFQIQAVEDLLGIVASDITRMRGSFDSPLIENGRFILKGTFPLSTSIDYPVKLSSRSGGKARISTRFSGYRECPDELGVIRPFFGISPLDTAKYILKARKALK